MLFFLKVQGSHFERTAYVFQEVFRTSFPKTLANSCL